MGEVKSHRDLIVWQKAMDMTVAVYKLARQFPKTEQYNLVSQITRAAASVPANIAEGKARATTREYLHFLSIARASPMEVDIFIGLAYRLEYISQSQMQEVLTSIDEVGRLLNAIRSKLYATINP